MQSYILCHMIPVMWCHSAIPVSWKSHSTCQNYLEKTINVFIWWCLSHMSHVNVSVLSFSAVLKASAVLIARIPQVRDNLVVFVVFEMCSFLKICLVIPFLTYDYMHHIDSVFNDVMNTPTSAITFRFATLETLLQLQLLFIVALSTSAAIQANSTPC